jgi:hypothetical protein
MSSHRDLGDLVRVVGATAAILDSRPPGPEAKRRMKMRATVALAAIRRDSGFLVIRLSRTW